MTGFIDLNDKAILITGGTGSFGNGLSATRWPITSRGASSSSRVTKPNNTTWHRGFRRKNIKSVRYFIGDVRIASG